VTSGCSLGMELCPTICKPSFGEDRDHLPNNKVDWAIHVDFAPTAIMRQEAIESAFPLHDPRHHAPMHQRPIEQQRRRNLTVELGSILSNLPDCARLRTLHKRYQYQTALESCQVGIASAQMLQNLSPQPLKALPQRRRERRGIIQWVGRCCRIEISAERWGDPDEGKRRVSPPVRVHLHRAEIHPARGSVPCVRE
jgi:hypothetical protein